MSEAPLKNNIDPQEVMRARRILWYDGNLQWKLHSTQKEMYTFLQENPNKILVMSCSRRLGKSYLLLILAIEICLKKPEAIVKFLAPEIKMIKKILRPIMNGILKDCPNELRPVFKYNENVYRFANKSEIQLAATDGGNAESLRGGASDICIIDEAGFCSDLDYITKQILLPTTTTTGGKIIMLSTPPRTQDHEYIDFLKAAQLDGAYVKKTIYDNPLITKEQIADIIKALGGEDTPEFRREYLCELNIAQQDRVVPEFLGQTRENTIKEMERPPFYDAYVCMDVGFKDLTAVLFAYYDYRNAKIVIEDEFVISGFKMTTDTLADAIKRKEAELWKLPNTGTPKPPYLRISDTNLILLNDLYNLHKLTFITTAKDDKMAAVNTMRLYVAQGKIVISPKCKNLIHHLDNATWNSKRNNFDRSTSAGEADIGDTIEKRHHYDCIDALIYLVRNVDMRKNPYPANFDLLGKGDLFFNEFAVEVNKTHEFFRNLFTVKKGGRRR